jgi:hypothetical protein
VQFAIDRVVNPGSVGLPNSRATAWWAVIEDGQAELRTTDYDIDAVATAMRASPFPHAAEFADDLPDPPTLEQLLGRIG